MIKNDSQGPSCTCPSGDGSLVHPCPAHPAVEQVGGDERTAFEAWATHLPMDRQPLRPDLYMPPTQWAWEAWQFRAALSHAPTSSASPSCKWTESSGIWETGCGQTWSFIEDGPAENGALFCHHCGGRLVLIKSDDQEDDGEQEGVSLLLADLRIAIGRAN
ncbi:hypothetical protein ACSEOT_29545 [Pseudomonas aeruginosa]